MPDVSQVVESFGPIEVLLVEDEEAIREDVSLALRDAGHSVTEAADGTEACRLSDEHAFDIAILDVRLPGVDGLTVLSYIRKQSPSTAVVLVTAHATVTDAVGALKEGAFDFVTKPFDAEEFARRVVGRAAERVVLRREMERARRASSAGGQSENDSIRAVVGRSPVFTRVLQQVELIAETDAPVLLSGESGTGKELVARMLHGHSSRRNRPFVAVNCAALPETLLEAELFGHERGAFTGAERKRDGRFKAADGGTLLLDEIAEIPLSAQTKLLRVLQEKTIEPLGSNVSIAIDVRIISATNKNLKELVAQRRFREDLYYRLNVLDLTLPPLRERRGDLPPLLEHFLRRFTLPGQSPAGITPRAWAALSEYPFPGNVRELEHAIERAVLLARGSSEIDIQHLPRDIVGGLQVAGQVEARGLRTLGTAMREFEREYLARALGVTSGHRAELAKLLGISRKSLWQKLRLHGLSKVSRRADDPSAAETDEPSSED